MKKLLLTLTLGCLLMGAASAYNPPLQGENLFYLSHPELLTGGISASGGGIMSVMPASTTINPALGALEERVSLDLGYTAIFCNDKEYSEKDYAQAFGAGIIVPTDWASFAGEFEGIFCKDFKMHLANSFHVKASASKEVMDNLFLGVGVGFGYLWDAVPDNDKDMMIGLDIGALYNFGDVGFLKNFRVAASANNLGKTFNKAAVLGVKDFGDDPEGFKDGFLEGFPSVAAFRVGAAAELVRAENFALGLSVDVTTPMFRNFIIDSGIQIEMMNFIRLNSSWEYNVKEVQEGRGSWIPTVGLVFKFNIGMGKSDFVKKNDWSQSEFCPSAGWKNVDGNINMVSGGAVLRLGQRDTSGPDIEID